MILGLDISTSCTGYSIIDLEGDLVDQGYIRLKQSEDHFSRVQDIKKCISEKHSQYQFTHIFIEQNLQSFRSGFSSARTLSTLARFNGMVSLASFNVTGLRPEYINVNNARKSVGLKIISKKKGGKPTKEQVVEWVTGKIEDTSYKWPVKILKSGPRKGQIILDPGCYDIADAYVIAEAGRLILSSCENS